MYYCSSSTNLGLVSEVVSEFLEVFLSVHGILDEVVESVFGYYSTADHHQ